MATPGKFTQYSKVGSFTCYQEPANTRHNVDVDLQKNTKTPGNLQFHTVLVDHSENYCHNQTLTLTLTVSETSGIECKGATAGDRPLPNR